MTHGHRGLQPLDKPVTVQFTPSKSGQLRCACGMDMISGVIVVEEPRSARPGANRARPARSCQRVAVLLDVSAILVVRGRIELPTWGL
jgi:plastocyanin domain-containing protein